MARSYDPEVIAGFGVLQYLSTAFLAAYMLVGILAVLIVADVPLIAILMPMPGGMAAILATDLAFQNPGRATAAMAAAWPCFWLLRVQGWLSGQSLVLVATALATLVLAGYLAMLEIPMNGFFLGVGAILGALYGLAFWAILRLWIWRRAAREPSIAETFQ